VELTRAATEETMNIGTLLTRHARYRPHHVAVARAISTVRQTGCT
jgi:hypothetical protein